MRPVREITAEEENLRTEVFYKDKSRECSFIKRDPIEPEPVGTIIVMAFRIVGYDKDCDGSLMARLECINKKGESTGWEPNGIGLYPDTDLVITQEELSNLFEGEISFSTVENEGE